MLGTGTVAFKCRTASNTRPRTLSVQDQEALAGSELPLDYSMFLSLIRG